MSLVNLYCIHDRIARSYAAPFTARNHDVAIRSFQISGQSQAAPEDFSLYFVGTVDDETGVLNPEPKGPIFLTDYEIILESVKEQTDGE